MWMLMQDRAIHKTSKRVAHDNAAEMKSTVVEPSSTWDSGEPDSPWRRLIYMDMTVEDARQYPRLKD